MGTDIHTLRKWMSKQTEGISIHTVGHPLELEYKRKRRQRTTAKEP